MQGRELRYQNGFDCQGLWVEVEVEKGTGFRLQEGYRGLRPGPVCAQVQAARAAHGRGADRASRCGWATGWTGTTPTSCAGWRTNWGRIPQEVITVQGPEGPVTDTVEQIVGRLGLRELGGSYFTFSNENNYVIWTHAKQVLGERLAVPWRGCHALVPALRHRHQPARDRHRRLCRAHARGRDGALSAARGGRPGDRTAAESLLFGRPRPGRCPATWPLRSAPN